MSDTAHATGSPLDRLSGMLDDNGLTPGDEGFEEREDEEAPQSEDLQAADDDFEGSDDEAGNPEPTPDMYEVTVNGERVKVSRDELLNGYSRQADYTRKTQELAAQRQQLEREWSAIEPLKAQLSEVLKGYQTEQEPDWDHLRQNDPYQYAIAAADWQQKQAKKQQAEAQMQALQQEEARRRQQAEMAYVREQENRLLDMMPAWKDSEVRQKESVALVEYLTGKHGFTQADMNALSHGDARLVAIADKARKYDALLAQRGQVQKKVEGKPVIRPGASNDKASRAAETQKQTQSRLKRTGRVGDGARAIGALLGKDL